MRVEDISKLRLAAENRVNSLLKVSIADPGNMNVMAELNKAIGERLAFTKVQMMMWHDENEELKRKNEELKRKRAATELAYQQAMEKIQ